MATSDTPPINAEQLKEAFATVEQLCHKNAELATKIRAGIRGFELRLQQMEGKVPARVHSKSEDGQITLSFERHGSKWYLLYSRKSTDPALSIEAQPLLNADVDAMMQAIRMLPGLMTNMVQAHQQQLDVLAPAAEALQELGISAVGLYDDGAEGPEKKAA